MKLDDLKTIPQMVESNPDLFTENKLKHMARMREHNGLAKAFVIIAGKTYVNPPALEKGIEERNEA